MVGCVNVSTCSRLKEKAKLFSRVAGHHFTRSVFCMWAFLVVGRGVSLWFGVAFPL